MTTEHTSQTAATESTKVPQWVLTKLQSNLATLREIRSVVDQTIQGLDERVGGRGRYEADALRNRQGDILRGMAQIDLFRGVAAMTDVDAEAVLSELGGVPDFTPSERARAWMEPKTYATAGAGAALEAAYPFGYRSSDSAP